MLDIGWSELLVVGVVALIVVGPRDLPKMFHTLGRLSARARSMAREFTSAMEDAAKDSGLDEASKSLRDVKDLTSRKSLGLDALDKAAERFEKWEPKIPSGKTSLKPDPSEPAKTPTQTAPEPASAAASIHAPDPTEQHGARRLHAVRRSDRSDDSPES